MAYTELQEDTKIRASILNANFQSIKDYANTLVGNVQSSVNSQIAAQNSNIDNKIATINNAVASCVKTSGNQTINGTKDFKGTTKVPASAADGTALQNTKIVKGGNGYCKLGNGLIIQWGASSTHQSDGRYTVVSYPIAFSSDSSYRVISNALSAYMSNDHSSWIYSKTRSGCVIANAVTGLTHLWVAIGS
jgi:hypothetical protein